MMSIIFFYIDFYCYCFIFIKICILLEEYVGCEKEYIYNYYFFKLRLNKRFNVQFYGMFNVLVNVFIFEISFAGLNFKCLKVFFSFKMIKVCSYSYII